MLLIPAVHSKAMSHCLSRYVAESWTWEGTMRLYESVSEEGKWWQMLLGPGEINRPLLVHWGCGHNATGKRGQEKHQVQLSLSSQDHLDGSDGLSLLEVLAVLVLMGGSQSSDYLCRETPNRKVRRTEEIFTSFVQPKRSFWPWPHSLLLMFCYWASPSVRLPTLSSPSPLNCIVPYIL